MNPKTPQDLDPKLKEAYDRVMGGNFNPSAPMPNPVPPKAENPPPPPSAPAVNPTPYSAPLATPAPADMPPLSVMSPSTAASGEQVISTKKKSKISPIIFLLGGFVFLVIYAVVWGKIFNLF